MSSAAAAFGLVIVLFVLVGIFWIDEYIQGQDTESDEEFLPGEPTEEYESLFSRSAREEMPVPLDSYRRKCPPVKKSHKGFGFTAYGAPRRFV